VVTSSAVNTPSLGVRTLAATLGLIALLYIAATAGRIEGQVAPFLVDDPAMTTTPSSTTFTKVVGSTTYSRTYEKLSTETEEEFDVRAKALWEAYCDLHGI
jgi:hypothetical protein